MASATSFVPLPFPFFACACIELDRRSKTGGTCSVASYSYGRHGGRPSIPSLKMRRITPAFNSRAVALSEFFLRLAFGWRLDWTRRFGGWLRCFCRGLGRDGLFSRCFGLCSAFCDVL